MATKQKEPSSLLKAYCVKITTGNGSTANSRDSSIQTTWRSKHSCTEMEFSFSYFIIASVIRDNVRQKGIMLHLLGPETERIFDTLTPEDDTYEKAMQILNEHLKQKKNVPFEISVFHKASQKQGESMEQFVTRLRQLSLHCEYAATLNEQIRDQIIATCTSSKLRKKLLEQGELDLDKTLKIVREMEGAKTLANQTHSLNSHDSSSGTINEIKPKHTSYNNRNQKTSTNKNTRTHVQLLNAHDAVPKSDVVIVIKRVDTATKRDTSEKCVLVKQNKTI